MNIAEILQSLGKVKARLIECNNVPELLEPDFSEEIALIETLILTLTESNAQRGEE